jgi:hypothetical protein
MVKIRGRVINKRYKRKDYGSQRYEMDFPVEVNPQIAPHENKDFDDIEITTKDTPQREVLNIQLSRNKPADEVKRQNTKQTP